MQTRYLKRVLLSCVFILICTGSGWASTFGFSGTNNSSRGLGNGMYCSHYASPSSGTLTKITANFFPLTVGGATANFIGAVYADSAGTPTSLLGSSTQVSVDGNAGGNHDFTMVTPFAITATTYWLCVYGNTPGAAAMNIDNTAPAASEAIDNTGTYPTPQGTYTVVFSLAEDLNIIATYTASGSSSAKRLTTLGVGK